MTCLLFGSLCYRSATVYVSAFSGPSFPVSLPGAVGEDSGCSLCLFVWKVVGTVI